MNGGGAIEIRVDVASTGDFEFGEAGERVESGHDFLGDDFWRLAEFAGELECDGRGDFAKVEVGRRLERNRGDLEIVFFFKNGAKTIGEPLFEFENHAGASGKCLIFLVILAPEEHRVLDERCTVMSNSRGEPPPRDARGAMP